MKPLLVLLLLLGVWQGDGEVLDFHLNGQTAMYRRAGAQPAPGTAAGGGVDAAAGGLRGVVAPELVGKWCYVNVGTGGGGSFSAERCITVHEDGTYEFYAESSRSVSGADWTGGTASQSGDRGYWRLDGGTLYVQSQAAGFRTHTLQKVNHPQNGDPMIVIDGEAYVTVYQRAPWP